MKKNGFTLIEMLVVLSFISILLFLSIPLQFQSLTNLSEKSFIDQFKHDVLFLQNQSGMHQRDSYHIRFCEDYYQVFQSRHPQLSKRHYPKNWRLRNDTRADLSYAYSGSIRNPRTIRFYSETEEIDFVFPLGKGGFHVTRRERILND